MCHLTPSERSNLLPRSSEAHHAGNNNDGRSCWQSFVCRKSDQQQRTTTNGHHHHPAAADDTTNNSDVRKQENRWTVILFGQLIALALSCANAASSTLENDYQIKVPTFQTGLVYFVLSFHLIYLFWRHRIKQEDEVVTSETMTEEILPSYQGQSDDIMQQLSIEDEETPSSAPNTTTTLKIQPSHTFPFTTLPLHTPWHIYLLLAILDVEANYLAMLSFQHTSLSSSMLLTSLSVLSTVLLRRAIFPSANYGRTRLLGVCMCLIGGCLWLKEEVYRCGSAELLDMHLASDDSSLDSLLDPTNQQQPQTYIVYGDLLALSASFLYGLNDVLAEYFVKTNNDRVEYLGMLGFFGWAFSFFVQVPLMEKDNSRKLVADVLGMYNGMDGDGSDVTSSNSMAGAIFLMMCSVIMLCFFYTSVMSFLAKYDATILNLSLQSCPLWAVVLTMLQKSMTEENNSGGRGIIIPPFMFFVSLAMVMAGMFLYESHSGNELSGGEDGEDIMECTTDDAKHDMLDRDQNTEVII